jgi:hypothetical protein
MNVEYLGSQATLFSLVTQPETLATENFPVLLFTTKVYGIFTQPKQNVNSKPPENNAILFRLACWIILSGKNVHNEISIEIFARANKNRLTPESVNVSSLMKEFSMRTRNFGMQNSQTSLKTRHEKFLKFVFNLKQLEQSDINQIKTKRALALKVDLNN